MIVKIAIVTMAILILIDIIVVIQFIRYCKIHQGEEIAQHKKYMLSRLIIILAIAIVIPTVELGIQILKIFHYV